MRTLFMLATAFASLLLVGCGGGGGSQGTAPEKRAATVFTIAWPTGTKGRYIPSNANYVAIALDGPTKAVLGAAKASAGTSTIPFSGLTAGDYTVTAYAYQVVVGSAPQTVNPTTIPPVGTPALPSPVASGSLTIHLNVGANSGQTLVLDGDVAQLRVMGLSTAATIDAGGSNPTSAAPGYDLTKASEAITVQALDSTGNTLLIDPALLSASVVSGTVGLAPTTGLALGYTITPTTTSTGTASVKFTYAGPLSTRDFTLNFNLVQTSGYVKISGLPRAFDTSLVQLQATLVEQTSSTTNGATYAGVYASYQPYTPAVGNPGDPGYTAAVPASETLHFTGVAPTANPFFVRLGLRVRTASGGYVDLVPAKDLSDTTTYAYSGTNGAGGTGLIQFGATSYSLGATNAVTLPPAYYASSITLPGTQANGLTFKRGDGTTVGTYATIPGVSATLASGTVVLDPALFSYAPATGSSLAVTGYKVTSTAASPLASAQSVGIVATFDGGDPNASPTTTIPVTVNPNGGTIGSVTIG